MANLTKQPIRRVVNDSYLSEQLLTSGPVEISKEAYCVYTSRDAPDYNDPKVMFRGWIDEREVDGCKTDDLRRLILRDILEQTHGAGHTTNVEHTGIHAHYQLDQDFNQILISGAGGIRELRELLRMRPKLLKELSEELLSNAEAEIVIHHEIGHEKARAYSDIILILLSLVDEETGRRLWRCFLACHYRSDHDLMGGIVASLFAAVEMPQWLRDENAEKLATELRKSFPRRDETASDTDCTCMLQRKSNYLRWLIDDVPVSDVLSRFVGKKYFPYEGLTDEDITVFLSIVENNIPEKGFYMESLRLTEFLPRVQDKELASRIARRHIMAYDAMLTADPAVYVVQTLQREPKGVDFLYWVLGLLYRYRPADHEALGAVGRLLDYAGRKE